jgi:hypothetical protein
MVGEKMSIEHNKSKNLNRGVAGSYSTLRKLPLGILSVLIALISLLIGIAATFISSSLLQSGPDFLEIIIGFTSWFLTVILFLFFYLRNEAESPSDQGLRDDK